MDEAPLSTTASLGGHSTPNGQQKRMPPAERADSQSLLVLPLRTWLIVTNNAGEKFPLHTSSITQLNTTRQQRQR
jgi:hypothetical protein